MYIPHSWNTSQFMDKTPAQCDIERMVFSLPPQNIEDSTFKVKFDKTQRQLQSIAAVDDLLSGAVCKLCDLCIR